MHCKDIKKFAALASWITVSLFATPCFAESKNPSSPPSNGFNKTLELQQEQIYALKTENHELSDELFEAKKEINSLSDKFEDAKKGVFDTNINFLSWIAGFFSLFVAIGAIIIWWDQKKIIETASKTALDYANPKIMEIVERETKVAAQEQTSKMYEAVLKSLLENDNFKNIEEKFNELSTKLESFSNNNDDIFNRILDLLKEIDGLKDKSKVEDISRLINSEKSKPEPKKPSKKRGFSDDT